ncbi:SCO family protein [Sphingomonas sp. GlSt437]
MNDLFRRGLALALPLVLAAGCTPAAQKVDPPLAHASIGGPFTLTDQTGKRVSDRDFTGKFRLMYFGYTYCPDVCPVDVQNLARGLKVLEKRDAALAARIVPIFISVDPARDTPAVLKQFVGAFHPRMVGLTGTPAEIAQVAREFRIYYKAQAKDATGAYTVDHSRVAYLMGPEGQPLALVRQDGTPNEIADDLEQWAR